jgi:hypothetical protein
MIDGWFDALSLDDDEPTLVFAKPPLRKLSTPDHGKRGVKAPCGCPGEVVIGSYVRCLSGHDGVPEHVEPEKTQPVCSHSGQYEYDGHVWCTQCGRFLRTIKPRRKP